MIGFLESQLNGDFTNYLGHGFVNHNLNVVNKEETRNLSYVIHFTLNCLFFYNVGSKVILFILITCIDTVIGLICMS